MYVSPSSVYGLQLPSRALCAQAAARERHRFFCGSASNGKRNALHVVEYQEDSHELFCSAIYSVPGRIWCAAASPGDARAVALSTSTADGRFTTGVMRLAEEGSSAGAAGEDGDPDAEGTRGGLGAGGGHRVESEAESVGLFADCDTRQRALLYHPAGEDGAAPQQVAALDGSSLRLFDCGGGAMAQVNKFSVTDADDVRDGCWSPHQPREVAVAHGRGLSAWDLRGGCAAQRVPGAHAHGATSCDYNPNRPFCIVSAGEDRCLKFWDLRRSAAPLMVVANHAHWVTRVRFNPFHDQLLASAGTDHRVTLWRVTSISSQPLVELEGEGAGREKADVKVRTFEEHEESVYGLAWSACTAWVFASLSYDGRVMLHTVPEAEKYKILL